MYGLSTPQGWLDLISLMIGLILSYRSGKNLVKWKHDVVLAKEMNIWNSPAPDKLTYLVMLFGFLFTFTSLIFSNILSILIPMTLATLTSTLATFAISVAMIIAIYSVSKHKYKTIKKPLTLQGKIVIKSQIKSEGRTE